MAISNSELKTLFNKQAGQYEKLRKKKKTIDTKWRKELLSTAAGHILEVSVGAGTNFKFYPKDAVVTAVDISDAMITKAKEAALDTGITTSFINAPVEELQFEPGSFDTIVSTLSLCAYEDPVSVLNQFNQWCRKDGYILLLEHGASKYTLVHWLQNKLDRFQYRRIGCHANREILNIVQQSTLQIKMYKRKLMGIFFLVWAKPGSGN